TCSSFPTCQCHFAPRCRMRQSNVGRVVLEGCCVKWSSVSVKTALAMAPLPLQAGARERLSATDAWAEPLSVINVVYTFHELAQSCVVLTEIGPRYHPGPNKKLDGVV